MVRNCAWSWLSANRHALHITLDPDATAGPDPAFCVAEADPAWRYLNIRRYFNYLEESILIGTQWVVFEPNDETLWKRVSRNITAFLLRIYNSGALMGKTPEEAFFVKCDAETNPPDVIEAGQVVCEIGIAPVKPAEFVIFQLSQFSGGASVLE